jgi:hypothetical protein
MSSSRTRLAAALILGLAVFGSGTHGTSASETLASATFDDDLVGATARPNGPLTVSEEVYDDSDTSGGVSAVVAYGTGRRYALSDVGTSGGRRGIRAPLSSTVSSGTLVVSAVVSAGQTGAGGLLCLSTPDEDDWVGMVTFGSDGKLHTHAVPSTVSYAADHRYLVQITVVFGSGGHVDYAIRDLTTSQDVLSSTGNTLTSGVEAGSLFFTTGTTTDGAFSIDDLLATLG